MQLKPGLREQSEEKVLLVCRARTGGIRIDWWPSEAEARAHDMEILEVRERIRTPKRVAPKGIYKVLETFLGRSASQDRFLHTRIGEQKVWFNRDDDGPGGPAHA
jgi:hypothetical protein